jgi:hypothetical protein
MTRARSFLPLLLALAPAWAPACTTSGNVAPPPAPVLIVGGTAGTVSWSESAGVITAQNALLALRWDAASGALVGVKSLATGTDFLGGAHHASWEAAIDAGTADLWSARAALAPAGRATPTLVRFEVNVLAGGGVTFDLGFAPVGAVTVVQHATLAEGDPVSHWTTDVTVAKGSSTTVVELASPELLGVSALPGETLAWPWHEGTLLAGPGAALQTMTYPSLAGMQWQELFDGREGLYYAALDSSGTFKEIDFGYDPALGDGSQPRQMRVAFYPFATTGQTYTTPPVDVGVAPEGSWYWAADRYRAFLASAGMQRAQSPAVQTLLGWHKGYNRWPQVPPDLTSRPPDVSYCDTPNILMPADYTAKTGLTFLLTYGWHYDGQDSFFPDYDYLSKNAPDPTCLQASDLTASLQAMAARPVPNRQMFYVNGHIADEASDWFQVPANAASRVMDANGQPYVETYADQPSRTYEVMCPSAPAWQAQLDATATRVRTLAPPGAGAVGIYWDQVEEEPAELCYDRTHGHATPATAYAEGYKAMFTRIHADFGLGGTDTSYVFAAEGANDYYSQFIDVAAGMPGRLLGYAGACGPAGGGYPCCPTAGCVVSHAPEIGRYTLFAKQLGLSNYTQAAKSEEFALAFLLGDPIRTNPPTDPTKPYGTTNLAAVQRYTGIYQAEPTIYLTGTFKAGSGLALSADPATALGTVIVGSANDRLAVQLWNETGAAVTVTATVDLARLGLTATSAAAVTDLDGLAAPALTVSGTQASFAVSVPAHDVKALKIAM